VFTGDELASAEAFQDRMTDLKTELKQVAGRLALELLPAVEKIAVKFREWIEENEPLIREQAPKILAFFGAFTSVAFSVVEWLGKLILSTGDLSTVLETLALAFVAVKLAMAGPAGMVAAAALAGIAIGNLMNAFGASDALANFLGDLTGLNEELGILDRRRQQNRGEGAKLAGGDIGEQPELIQFTQGGKVRQITENALLDIAVGDLKSSEISQEEALRIVGQLDRQKDPGRQARATQRGKAAAAQAELERKPGKPGKAKAPTGLEAQIEQRFKAISSQAELRESARALREGKSGEEAFAIGREAAKQTEQRLRQRFDATRELPEGIARDIDQLARSPAVEESIGRVPPPVISVVNNVNNVTVTGNEFRTEVEANMAAGVTVAELTKESARATMRLINTELGDAVSNLKPTQKV
jgi:hypothetical protein